MSLHLGKIGRKIVKFTIDHPHINNVVDKLGQGISSLSDGRYKVGLTRLAYTISQQLSVRDKIKILDGKILNVNGKVIAKDNLLEVGKDMGPIRVREPLATPEGMANFLRYIYLNPERWGITISEKFTQEQKNLIKQQIAFMNKKLGINLDPSTSLFVKPTSLRSRPILLCTVSFLLSATLFYEVFNKTPRLTDIQHTLLFIGGIFSFLVSAYQLGRARSCKASYIDKTSTAKIKKGETPYFFAHEYIHFLRYWGFIDNIIVANAYEILVEQELSGKTKYDEEYEYGMKIDPYYFITRTKIYYDREFLSLTYIVGKRLAGVAAQLAKITKDPESKWEFLKIVQSCKNEEKLLTKLQKSKFKKIFTSPKDDK